MSDSLELSPAGRRYGCHHDTLSPALKATMMLRLAADVKLPPRAATSAFMGPIRDQGDEGSCTGHAGNGVRNLIYRKRYMFERNRKVAPQDFDVSPAFIYKCNLIADRSLGLDAGSTIQQTALTLHDKGACLESQEPYNVHDYLVVPTDAQYDAALDYTLGTPMPLASLAEIKACIASGYSVAFGMDVYESFESAEIVNNGLLRMPKRGERSLGGHAQHALDYDDTVTFLDGCVGGLFVQNSWGRSWGVSAPGRTDRGCYWMPYEFVRQHVRDIWTLRQAQPAFNALMRAA